MRIPRRNYAKNSGTERKLFPHLLLLSAFFVFGIILGQVAAEQISPDVGQEMTKYLESYLSINREHGVSGASLLSAAMIYYRYPVLAFLLGFIFAGSILIPLLTVAYGFFLAFSACCVVTVFGEYGILIALAMFGIRCLLTLPCYFWMAAMSFQYALALVPFSTGNGKRILQPIRGKERWICFAIAALALLGGVLLEQTLSPYLLDSVLKRVLAYYTG